MGWWFSPKNIYGLIMGTSTDIMKPVKRPHWPTTFHRIDNQLSVFLGGTGNCGVLKSEGQYLLINCNSGRSALSLKSGLPQNQPATLVGTSTFPDYIGGIQDMEFQTLYLPQALGHSSLEGLVQVIGQEMTLSWEGKDIHVLPVENAFSQKDLVVYLPQKKVLFLGGLFFNNIHPVMDIKRGKNIPKWIATLKMLLKRFPEAETVVPHEGDLCGHQGVQKFIDYLTTLSDATIEFSFCRENFDWVEIPGHTSLEENFDHCRKS